MVKVSVVVPVYNPWPWIQSCVESLTRQTMAADDFEVIFVDDGSTDQTPAYLDELARQQPNVTVIHQENSGWPGKPRNVGIDAARGKYVFFCDNDDWLGDEALTRMWDYAEANAADVVLVKMAGIGRPVPQNIFRHSRPSATLADAPLMDALTPHKLFRREFLLHHGIRFPEGRRRLEDHYFVVTSYLLAERISVYADYTCYYHIRREDSSNAGFSAINWDSYFVNLSEAVDVVEAHTEPGNLRDRIYRRWLQNEMVNRLSGRRFTSLDEEQARLLFEAAHRTAARYFGEGTVRQLPVLSRGVARSLIAGDLDAVRQLAEAEQRWELRTRLLQASWVEGRLQVSGIAGFEERGAPPGAGLRESALFSRLDGDELATGLAKSTLVLDLTERRTGERWTVAGTVERHGPLLTFQADLDPLELAGGDQLPEGVWDLYVECNMLGLRRRGRLALRPERLPSPALASPRPATGPLVAAYLTKNNHGLSLDVGLVFHPRLDPDRATEEGGAEATEQAAEDTAPSAPGHSLGLAAATQVRRRGAGVVRRARRLARRVGER